MKSSSPEYLPALDKTPSRLVTGDEPRATARQPLLAVVIPTYRRPALLRQTLDSVLAQPGIEDAEIVVTDNFPEEDETAQMMRADFQRDNLRYYKNSCNLNSNGNWNRMVQLARAKWCVMLHDDDLMLPGRLPLLRRIAEALPDAALVSFRALEFKGDTPYAGPAPLPRHLRLHPLPLHELQRRDYVSTCCTLFRRDRWMEAGGTDTTGRHDPCPDYDLWLRMTRQFNATWLCDTAVGAYRWLDNDSLNPETIRRIVAQNLAFQLEATRGASRTRFLHTISLSYEYLRKRLRQIGMAPAEIDDFYRQAGFPRLSPFDRLRVFLHKTAVRLRQELLPPRGQITL